MQGLGKISNILEWSAPLAEMGKAAMRHLFIAPLQDHYISDESIATRCGGTTHDFVIDPIRVNCVIKLQSDIRSGRRLMNHLIAQWNHMMTSAMHVFGAIANNQDSVTTNDANDAHFQFIPYYPDLDPSPLPRHQEGEVIWL